MEKSKTIEKQVLEEVLDDKQHWRNELSYPYNPLYDGFALKKAIQKTIAFQKSEVLKIIDDFIQRKEWHRDVLEELRKKITGEDKK